MTFADDVLRADQEITTWELARLVVEGLLELRPSGDPEAPPALDYEAEQAAIADTVVTRAILEGVAELEAQGPDGPGANPPGARSS